MSRKDRVFSDRKSILIVVFVVGLVLKRIFRGNLLLWAVVYLVAIAGICTLFERLNDRNRPK